MHANPFENGPPFRCNVKTVLRLFATTSGLELGVILLRSTTAVLPPAKCIIQSGYNRHPEKFASLDTTRG